MSGDADPPSAGESPADPARRRARRVAIAWTLIVVAASLVDPAAVPELVGASTPTGGAGAFAAAHLVAYGVLAWLLVGKAGPDAQTDKSRAVVASIAVAAAVGVGVELLQSPLPARAASAADALVNAVGATVGAGLRAAFERR